MDIRLGLVRRGIMLEKLAQVSYRYYQEAKVYVIFTIAVFGLATIFSSFGGGWQDAIGMGSLLLFLGVFGNAMLFGFCMCIFFIAFVYAFHPELNGKEQGSQVRVFVTRTVSLFFSLGSALLLYFVFSGHHHH